MALRNRTKLNLRIVDESPRAPAAMLRDAPGTGDHIGRFLKAWREHRGWTIDYVAWVLRIRLAYLEAIEADRLEELPGRIYVTGFIRSYAKLLGVDVAAVIRHLRLEHVGIDQPGPLTFPEPPSERAVPGGAIMAVGIVISIVVYGGWYYQTASSRSEYAAIPSIPGRLVATLDPTGTGAERYDLPAAMPMQPPMRPSPVRTVSSYSGEGSPEAPSVGVPSPAPGDQNRAGARVDGGSSGVASSGVGVRNEIQRGLPPDVGNANPVEIALGEIDRPVAREVRPDAANVSLSGVRDGRTTAGNADISPAPVAVRVPQPPRGRFASMTPQLPTAAMADAYAAGRVGGTVPPRRIDEPVAQQQPTPSASAAWAGSVDRMPPGQLISAGVIDTSGPVVLNAIEATWIEVREETGKVVTGKLLQPGDTYAVPTKSGLRLTTGNAGGLEVLVGGSAAPRLGPRGAVRRDIELDGEQLMAGAAVRN